MDGGGRKEKVRRKDQKDQDEVMPADPSPESDFGMLP